MLSSLRLTAIAALIAGGLAAAPALAVDTGGGSTSSDSSSSRDEPGRPTLDQARSQIDARNWKGAIGTLRSIVAGDPTNADALNLLGYSLRKSGDVKNAQGFYLKALKLNPRHKGANEYLGELYVEIGQIDKAKQRLKVLAQLCGNTTCEEYEDLEKAIAAAS